MSGHSKWATIRHKKGAKDAARAKVFTKLTRDIILAAQQGGGDMDTNFSLRLAVDRAKAANLPSDNIHRAIQKATGELKEGSLASVSYEAYGPGGSMLIIDCQTDNTNRTLTDVKSVLNTSGGKMASEGSISWQFEQIGLITLEPKEQLPSAGFGKEAEFKDLDVDELQLKLLDYDGVEDMRVEEGKINLFVNKEKLQSVRDQLMHQKLKVEEASLVKLPNADVALSGEEEEKFNNLVEKLEELDDIDQVWTNVG